jgi:hypothetical protein
MYRGARLSPLAASHGKPMVLCSRRCWLSIEDSVEPLDADLVAEIRTHPYPFVILIWVVDHRMDDSYLMKP